MASVSSIKRLELHNYNYEFILHRLVAEVKLISEVARLSPPVFVNRYDERIRCSVFLHLPLESKVFYEIMMLLSFFLGNQILYFQ